MKTDRTPIRLCMGSSCYSRGNDQILATIKEYIEEHQLSEVTDFRGHLCQQRCSQGPNLTINDTDFNNVSESTVLLILKEVFERKENTDDIASKLNIVSEQHQCVCDSTPENSNTTSTTDNSLEVLYDEFSEQETGPVILKSHHALFTNKPAEQ